LGTRSNRLGDLRTANAKVRCDVQEFSAEIICCRHAFDAPGESTGRAMASLIKSMPQVWFNTLAATSGARTNALALLALPD